jgi:hypothetical protein
MTSELHAVSTPMPIEGYEAATRWAERATFDPNDPTMERGEVAAASGRALLQAVCVADGQVPTADVLRSPNTHPLIQQGEASVSEVGDDAEDERRSHRAGTLNPRALYRPR